MAEKTTGSSDFTGSTFTTDLVSGTVFTNPSNWIGGYWKFTSGVDTPNYHQRRRLGELLPLTEFTQWEQEYTFKGAKDLAYRNGNNELQSHYVSDYFDAAMADTANHYFFPAGNDEFDQMMNSPDYQEYVNRAVASLYTRGHDTLTFLAEFRKTADLVLNAKKRWHKLVSDTDSKKVADAWLEGRYGWRLLHYDVQDIAEQLGKLHANEFEVYKNRVGGNYRTNFSTTHQVGPNGVYEGQYVTRHNCKLSVRGNAVSKIAPPSWRFDPLATAWELVPYSFIVDWFVSVGTTIENISASLHHTDLRSSYGYHLEVKTRGGYENVILATPSVGSWSGYVSSSHEGKLVQNIRVPCDPTFIPSLSLNLDAYKALDLLALGKKNLNKSILRGV